MKIKYHINKKIVFSILVLLIIIDIVLTNFFIIVYNCIEINPLCVDFSTFMLIKIIVSFIFVYIAYKIKETPFWIIFIIISISIYIKLVFFNLNNIGNYFF